MSVQRVGFFFSGIYLDTQKCLISPRKLGQSALIDPFFLLRKPAFVDSLRESEGGVSKPNPKGLLDTFLIIKKLENPPLCGTRLVKILLKEK